MRHTAILAALAIATSACGLESTAEPIAPAPVATTLSIVDPGLVRDGDVRELRAEARAANGRLVHGVSVSWSATDPSIAIVTPQGMLTALREGSTEIVATAGSLQQRRPLSVVLHPAVSIELNVSQLTVPLGTRGGVSPILRGLDGRILLNRPLELVSSNEQVVRVSAAGELIPVGPGIATVTVRHGQLSATVVVRVPVPPAVTQYAVHDVDGTPLPFVLDSREVRRDGPFVVREFTRLERGTVSFGDSYQVSLDLVHYEQTEAGGNSIVRVLGRQTVRDHGQVAYDWLTGSATLQSEFVGGLVHSLELTASGPRLRFREAGTNNVWGLGLRLP